MRAAGTLVLLVELLCAAAVGCGEPSSASTLTSCLDLAPACDARASGLRERWRERRNAYEDQRDLVGALEVESEDPVAAHLAQREMRRVLTELVFRVEHVMAAILVCGETVTLELDGLVRMLDRDGAASRVSSRRIHLLPPLEGELRSLVGDTARFARECGGGRRPRAR